MPPDATWLGALAGCGGWLGGAMDPVFCVVELLPPDPLPGVLVLVGELLLLLGELVLLVPLPGDVVAWAG